MHVSYYIRKNIGLSVIPWNQVLNILFRTEKTEDGELVETAEIFLPQHQRTGSDHKKIIPLSPRQLPDRSASFTMEAPLCAAMQRLLSGKKKGWKALVDFEESKCFYGKAASQYLAEHSRQKPWVWHTIYAMPEDFPEEPPSQADIRDIGLFLEPRHIPYDASVSFFKDPTGQQTEKKIGDISIKFGPPQL